jgi:hypothetical protein
MERDERTGSQGEVIYRGERSTHGAVVWREVKGERDELPLRLDLWNPSPSGPEWGYAGSGPTQLALALLADAVGDDERAVVLHQFFKEKVVCGLPREGFMPTGVEVRTAAAELERETAAGLSMEVKLRALTVGPQSTALSFQSGCESCQLGVRLLAAVQSLFVEASRIPKLSLRSCQSVCKQTWAAAWSWAAFGQLLTPFT